MILFKDGYQIIGKDEIADIVKKVDESFSPPLSSKVNLDDYARKLYEHAHLIAAIVDHTLAGFCAFYDNDVINKKAFLTFIYTDTVYQKMGIGTGLINEMISILKQKQIIELNLEVFISNKIAISLYRKFNFETTRTTEDLLCMKKEL